MKDFQYLAPQTLDEAVAILADLQKNTSILSGGTDLLVQMRDGLHEPDFLIDIKRIPELTNISFDPAQGLTIGAAVPCRTISLHPEVCWMYPGLVDAVSLIGGVQIQGRASLGGNLCNASPAADSIPALIVHSARCLVIGSGASRQIASEDFCTAPGKNALAPGELLVSIHIPVPPAHFGAHYLRFTPRNEMDIAVVGAGASVVLDGSGEKFASARIALAAVAPVPLYLVEIGEWLAGKDVSETNIQIAADMVHPYLSPITDLRGTTEQRLHLAMVLVKRALSKSIQRAQGNDNRGGNYG